jgi:plastocyanin
MVVGSTAAFAGTQSAASGDSVVDVDATPGKTFPAPTKTALVSQRGLKFDPHIIVVQQRTTVNFQNDDSVQHNIFWPSVGGNKKFSHNLGTGQKETSDHSHFDHGGVVPLLCNVHPEMSGYVIVNPTPYFAETDSSGNFKIDNIPDGKYTVMVWHEGSKPQTKAVDVIGTAKLDLAASQ